VKTPARGTFHIKSKRKHALEYKYTYLFFIPKFGIPLYLLTFFMLNLDLEYQERLIVKENNGQGFEASREEKVCF